MNRGIARGLNGFNRFARIGVIEQIKIRSMIKSKKIDFSNSS
jgi:hypothetical protein